MQTDKHTTDAQRYVDAVRADMASRGISNREMAARLKISHPTLGRWLSGESLPRVSNYPDILACLSSRQVAEIEAAIGLPDGYVTRFRRQAAAMVAAAPPVGPTAAAVADSARQQLADGDGTAYRLSGPAGPGGLRSPQRADFAPNGVLQPVSPASLVKVPVVSLARAAGYRDCLGSSEFIDDLGDSEYWQQVPAGHLLFRVDGNSLAPTMPNGTVMQLDTTRYPRRGEICVAMIGCDESPVVKIYQRKHYVIALLPINENGAMIVIDTKDHASDCIHWLHPVVHYSAPAPTYPDTVDWAAIAPQKNPPA